MGGRLLCRRSTVATRPRALGDNTPYAMRSVVVDESSYDWEGDEPLRPPFARTVIYEMHVRGFTQTPELGCCRETSAAPTPVWWRRFPICKELGVTAVELLPVFQFDAQEAPLGTDQLLGLQSRLVLCAALRVQLQPGSAGPAQRVPRHGQGAAPGGHRGDPGCGLQPHGGGQSRRADLLLQGAGEQRLLHSDGEPRSLRQLQRHRQHAERQPACGAAYDPGQPPLLGGGDARGRLPL